MYHFRNGKISKCGEKFGYMIGWLYFIIQWKNCGYYLGWFEDEFWKEATVNLTINQNPWWHFW